MIEKMRCKCGAEFSPKDLSGIVRTGCPVCRAPVTAVPESAPPPVPIPSARPLQPAARDVAVAAVATPTTNARTASHPVAVGANWTPPAGLRNHAGFRLDASKFFPWGPPPEIGEVLFADSNVPRSGPPSFITPCLIAVGIWAATYLAFGEGLQLLPTKGDPTIMRSLAAGFGFLAGLLSLVWTWPSPPHCTYVGSAGSAYFTGKWGRAKPSESQVIVFREIAVLFTATTHYYKNLMYECTRFRFDWHSDVNKPPLLRIADEHTCHNDLPDPDHLFHFALRVEDVWTKDLTTRIGCELSADRTLTFPCRKSDFTEMLLGMANRNDIQEIRLNLHQIQFAYGDRLESLAIRDLGSFQAHRGVLKFQQDDVTWFSRQGKYRIDYQHLGNAQAFLHYLSMAIAAQ